MHKIFTVVHLYGTRFILSLLSSLLEGSESTCGHVDRTAIILRSQNKWKTTMGDWQCGHRVRL